MALGSRMKFCSFCNGYLYLIKNEQNLVVLIFLSSFFFCKQENGIYITRNKTYQIMLVITQLPPMKCDLFLNANFDLF